MDGGSEGKVSGATALPVSEASLYFTARDAKANPIQIVFQVTGLNKDGKYFM